MRPSTIASLDDTLLTAKMSLPELRGGMISRIDIISAGRSSTCRVVSVTAPAGYGKSTLLSEWASVEDRRVAWVSFDRFDNDPATMLALLASSFVNSTGADPSIVGQMQGLVGGPEQAARRLASALHGGHVPFALLLDNVDVVTSPDCQNLMEIVIAGVPRGCQLVATSRCEQPHVARLRASGDVFEIDSERLALDVEGARCIFKGALIDLDSEAAEAITLRTEGWPVGLYLASLMAGSGESDTIDVAGDDRFIADYFYREFFLTMRADSQQFLRRTSLFEDFSADLCDAVLHVTTSQAQLREMEDTNAFVIALDTHRERYRYHSLFREFLLGELRRCEPELIPQLHSRAASWYEAHGSLELAAEHRLQTPHQSGSGRLISTLALRTLQAGQVERLRGWLAMRGDFAIEGDPQLSLVACWSAALSGRAAEADRWAVAVSGVSVASSPVDGSASFESGRAMLRAMMCASGPEQSMADAQFALDHEPSWSEWRGQAVALVAEGSLACGEVGRANDLFTEASGLAHASDNHELGALSDAELALIAMDQARWVEAAALVERAVSAVEANGLREYATAGITFAAATRLAVHRGETTGVRHELARAMRARDFCTYVIPVLAVRLRVCLARVNYFIGEIATARQLMREIEEIRMRRPALGTLADEVSAFEDLLRSARSGVPAAPLSPAELRLLPYLRTHLTIREVGERLYLSRNTISTEISAIYRKLGVSSRAEAVDRATVMGLIAPLERAHD